MMHHDSKIISSIVIEELKLIIIQRTCLDIIALEKFFLLLILMIIIIRKKENNKVKVYRPRNIILFAGYDIYKLELYTIISLWFLQYWSDLCGNIISVVGIKYDKTLYS